MIDVLLGSEFLIGILAGVGCVAVVVAIRRASDGRIYLHGGLLVCAGAGVALWVTGLFVAWSAIGLGLLAAGGLLGRTVAGRLVAALPGAGIAMMGIGYLPDNWVFWIGTIATVVGSELLFAFDREYESTGLAFSLMAAACLGLFLTVPETNAATVLLGVWASASFLGWPRPLARFGRPGSFAAIGLYVVVAATGSVGREAALVAGIACLGLLLIIPIRDWLFAPRTHHEAGSGWYFLILVQLGLGVAISRTGGRTNSVVNAAAVIAIWLSVAFALAGLPGTRASRDRGDS